MAWATRPVTSTKARSPSLRLVRSRRVGELGCQLENQPRALGRYLPESRVGHFRELGLLAGANPGASRRLFVEQPHFAEELALVEVCQHHLVAVLILDHDLDRARDDVVEDVGQIARVDDDGLGRDCPDSAVAQETIDRGDIA